MPELPEVELISRSLDSLVRGRTIVSAELLRPRLAPDIQPRQFARELRGRKINFIHRRGKHILFDLTGDRTLIVHLRMSGRFSLLAGETELPKFTHAVFHLATGDRLVFDDQRHFGLMKIVKTRELHDAKELKKLAPEPMSSDFSPAYLYAKTRGSKRKLKEFLIDQTRVCGLGNIYACEAMFAAGLNPRRMVARLTKPAAERLYQSILAVLNEAISHGAGRPVDPEDIEGNYFSGLGPGWYVYDREDKPCRDCGQLIVRIKQGARSTYFCRSCQRR
jgi:formamidopyrimidine-DNA glycosylase